MTANESAAALSIATGWARTVAALPDARLQVGWVREQLSRVGADRAADVLTIVLARAEQREARFAVLLLRVSLALAGPEDGGLKRAIACFAEARNQRALARFLGASRDAGPSDGDGPDANSATDRAERQDLETARALDPALARSLQNRGERPLSLGERKSLARRRDRNVLARVLREPHPDVVHILLDNPALTEADVVRLCARRPIDPNALVQVFRHPRWVLRYRVRLALVLNPYLPEDLAVQLLPHLTEVDRREVARSGELSERVRAACAASRDPTLH